MSAHSPADLQRIYQTRFARNAEYRLAVWRVLISERFQRYVRPSDTVLDLGCGYGEFINQIACATRYAMDLNPDAPKRVAPEVKCLLQDCSAAWPLPNNSLNLVFTSNFFEHPGGRLIAMGPNVRYLPGAYWDFWDHHVPLTELSLREALENRRFQVQECIPKFLPYTMAGGPRYPLLFLRAYLHSPLAWRFFGKQFLLVAVK